MTRLIVRLVFTNIALFVLLILIATIVGFLLGYGANNNHNTQLSILLALTALVQAGINFLIYRGQIRSNWKVSALIVLIVLVLYAGYHLMTR